MMPPRSAQLDLVLDRFEEAWEKGPPPLDEFLPRPTAANAALRLHLLKELIQIDLDHRWRPESGSEKDRSPRWCVEQYVERYPEVSRAESVLVDLVGEEYRVRRRWGARVGGEEYASRFAAQRTQVARKLAQIDAELAAEFVREGRQTVTDPGATQPRPAPTVSTLLEVLGQPGLLNPNQINELSQGRFAEAKALGRELLHRGWLTPFQVNQLLLQDGGRDLLLGPYVLLERLGAGGAGQVFKARHQRMDRLVAVKVIRRELLADAEMVGRFSREIQLVSQLSHPNVVRALDAGPISTAHVLVMEYVEGTTLADLVKRTGPLPVAQACDYIRQVALGLQHAHEHRLVHRDIKPPNLLLSTTDKSPTTGSGQRPAPHGTVKILDFGLGRLHGGGNAEATGNPAPADATSLLTPRGSLMMMGTPDYMAPEQALDFHGADIRADIYGLGCTFHYLLTGQPPFPGGTIPQKLLRHQQAPLPVLPQLSPELNGVLARMLAKRPEARYQSPGEVAQVLAAVSGGSTPLIPRARSVLLRWQRRPKRLAVIVGSLLLGLIAMFILLRAMSGSRSPLDELRANLIPAPKRFEGQPPELVAVLGVPVPGYSGICAATFATELDVLAYVDTPGNLWLWNVGQPQPELRAKHARVLGGVGSAAFSRDGQRLAIGRAQTVSLWDIARDPTELAQQKLVSETVGAVAFAPDGQLLVSGDDKRNLTFWDLSTGSPTKQGAIATSECFVRALAFTSNSKLLAYAGTFGAELALVDLTEKKAVVGRFAGHPIPGPDKVPRVFGLAFSPDSKTLASAGVDRTVRLWDVANRQELRALEGHNRPVHRVAFTRDGRMLASGDEEGRLILWDTSSWTRKYDWRLPAGSIVDLAVASDGRHLAVATNTALVYIFRLAP